MRLRVGLIGLGDAWQARYAPALRALADRFEVRAICDQVRHRAELAAAEFQAEAVNGYHALVQREDIDAIMLLSTQLFRALPILAACESRKAIYCAVGLEMDAEEAQTIKRRVEEAGVAFVAEFPRRHAPATLRLKELIATRLGPPRLLFCHQRAVVESPAHGPGGSPSVHPTFQQLIGQVDWCRYVVDRNPTSVVGVMHYVGDADGTEDYRMMSLDFSPQGKLGIGPTAQISCGRYVPVRLAGSDCLPAAAGAPGVVRPGHRLRGFAQHAGLVRRGRTASGIAGKRAAAGRAALDPFLPLRDQPGPPHLRPGRRLSCHHRRPIRPPKPRRRATADTRVSRTGRCGFDPVHRHLFRRLEPRQEVFGGGVGLDVQHNTFGRPAGSCCYAEV